MLIMRAFYFKDSNIITAVSINCETGEVLPASRYKKEKKTLDEIRKMIAEDHGITSYEYISIETIEIKNKYYWKDQDRRY